MYILTCACITCTPFSIFFIPLEYIAVPSPIFLLTGLYFVFALSNIRLLERDKLSVYVLL